MKILLVPNMDKVYTKRSIREIIEILEKEKFTIFLDEKYSELFLNLAVTYGDEDDFYKDADLVITIGGDGTILQAAKKAALFDTAVLGINAGRLGFLTTLETDEVHLLKNLIRQNKIIEKRMLVNISVKRKNEIVFSEDALNEIVLKTAYTSHLLEAEIFYDGRYVNSYRADGVIFSTPTGSTAYNLSAGGPIISPKVSSIAVTPISPHSLFSRTIIFPEDSEISVKLPKITQSNITQDAIINLDGHSDFIVSNSDEITIRKSSIYAKTVNLEDRRFFDVLNYKILGRV